MCSENSHSNGFRAPEWARRHPGLAALAGYLALVLLVFWPLVARIDSHILTNDAYSSPGKSDVYVFYWNHWWMQKALTEGRSVPHCDWVFPPTGDNLTLRCHAYVPTILTLPVAWAFGTAASYNVMVLLFLVGAAWSFNWFLRSTFEVSVIAAFAAGALFGLCPWFVWCAHGKPLLLGGVFWAAALGVVVRAYVRNEFGWRGSLLFAVLFWTVFWSSYLEFFMLAVVLAVTVIVFEADAIVRGDWVLHRRAAFFAPVLLGLCSLFILKNAAESQDASVPMMAGISIKDLIPSAKRSIFSFYGFPNRTAAVLPHSFAWLGLIGIVTARRRRMLWFWPLAVLAGVTLCLVVDPFQVPSTVIRAIPMGKGMRLFKRFIPFLFFYLLIFSCLGLDFLIRRWRPRKPDWVVGCRFDAAGSMAGVAGRMRKGAVIAAVLLVFAALECYPFTMSLWPVKRFPIDAAARARLDDGRFCLVVPRQGFSQYHDAYQVALDMPCTHMYILNKMDRAANEDRMARFPSVFKDHRTPYRPSFEDADFLDQLETLRVGYILFENKDDLDRFPWPGTVVFETDREILIELEPPDTL